MRMHYLVGTRVVCSVRVYVQCMRVRVRLRALSKISATQLLWYTATTHTLTTVKSDWLFSDAMCFLALAEPIKSSVLVF